MEDFRKIQVDDLYDHPFRPFFLQKADLWWAIGLFLVSFVLYLFTLTPRICAGDSGELTTAIYNLGAANPPGYPLYTMLGKLLTYIPVGTIAYRVNLLSAFFGALTIPFIYLLLVKLLQTSLPRLVPLRDRIISGLGAMLFALGQTMWSQAVIAEVYTLNIVFAPLLLLSVLVWQERVFLSLKNGVAAYGERILLLFALLLGMSFTNHLLLVGYMFPLVIFIIIIFFMIKPKVNGDPVSPEKGLAGLIFMLLMILVAGAIIYFKAWKVPLLDEDEALLTLIAVFIPANVLGWVGMYFLSHAQEQASAHAIRRSDRTFLFGLGALFVLFFLILGVPEMKAALNFMKTEASFNIMLVVFLITGLTIVSYGALSQRKKQESGHYWSRVAGLSFKSYLFFLVPILLYLTLVIRANAIAKIPDPPLSWGETADASRVINHFLRKQYPKGDMRFWSRIFEVAGAWGDWHLRQFTPWLLLFVPFGLFAMFRRNQLWFYLNLAIFVAFNFLLLWMVRFRVTPRDLSFPEVFFIPSYLPVVVWIAFGMQFLIRKAVEREPAAEQSPAETREGGES